MSDWLKRPYDPATDEDGVVYTWLRSYARSRYGMSLGAHRPNTDEAREFWDEHRPLVLDLIARSTITIACDPGAPAVIWGWVAIEGPWLHYVFVKRNVVRAGIGVDIVRDLLGELVKKPMAYTLEQVEMWGLRRDHIERRDKFASGADGIDFPPQWYPDFTYFARKEAA